MCLTASGMLVPPFADTVKTSADAAAREQLAKVVEVLVRDKVLSFEDCVAWGRLKFQVGLGLWLMQMQADAQAFIPEHVCPSLIGALCT